MTTNPPSIQIASAATETARGGGDALADHTWRRQHAITIKIRLSALYHQQREAFLGGADRWCTLLTAASATAAITSLLQRAEGLNAALSGATAVLALLPLVFDLSGRARRHSALAIEFKQLRSQGARFGEVWTPEQCDELALRMVEVEQAEPASLDALAIHCQNQVHASLGQPSHIYPLTLAERWFKHWVSFNGTHIVQRGTAPG